MIEARGQMRSSMFIFAICHNISVFRFVLGVIGVTETRPRWRLIAKMIVLQLLGILGGHYRSNNRCSHECIMKLTLFSFV